MVDNKKIKELSHFALPAEANQFYTYVINGIPKT